MASPANQHCANCIGTLLSLFTGDVRAQCDQLTDRPIGRYRRSEDKKSLTSLGTTSHFLVANGALFMQKWRKLEFWVRGSCRTEHVIDSFMFSTLTAADRPVHLCINQSHLSVRV